jgi:hypothetical protein
MNQPVAPLTVLNILNIFNYSMEALSNNGGDGQRYIRFDRRRDKETFIRYMLECYQEYINFTTTVDVQEKQNYKNKYDYYSDDELSDLFETNTNTERQMELCLFYDATEYTSNGGRFQLDEIDSKNHWLIRIGDGGPESNFRKGARFNTWGMKRASAVKGFEFLVKKGDILWFIPGGTDGYVLAFAEYVNHTEIDYATRHQRYAELGWNQHGNNREWNVEIHYRNLRYTNTTESVGDTLEDRNRYSTQIKGNSVNVRIYNSEKCRIDLPQLYSEIIAENT